MHTLSQIYPLNYNTAYMKSQENKLQNKSEIVGLSIKRTLGISCLLLRGKEKATGEISLAFTAFNMKRAIIVIEIERMIECPKA